MVSGSKLPLWRVPHPNSSSSLGKIALGLKGFDLWGDTAAWR